MAKNFEQTDSSDTETLSAQVIAMTPKNAREAGTAALLRAAGRPDEREARVAVGMLLKTEDWETMGETLVPVQDPQLQKQIRESGAEVFEGKPDDPKTTGMIFVKAYDLPIWSQAINEDEQLYPIVQSKFTMGSPHIANPEGKSLRQLQDAENKRSAETRQKSRVVTAVTLIRGITMQELQQQENKLATADGRPARLFVQKHHIARAIDTIRNYLDSGSVLSQAEAQYNEMARLAQEDPSIATEFGALLARIAQGGEAGVNSLGRLASRQSMIETINKLLSVPGSGAIHQDMRMYLEDAKRIAAGGKPQTSSTDQSEQIAA
jgi:hypothetical protein